MSHHVSKGGLFELRLSREAFEVFNGASNECFIKFSLDFLLDPWMYEGLFCTKSRFWVDIHEFLNEFFNFWRSLIPNWTSHCVFANLDFFDDLVVINTWNCCLWFWAVVFAGISFDERFGLSCPTKDIEWNVWCLTIMSWSSLFLSIASSIFKTQLSHWTRSVHLKVDVLSLKIFPLNVGLLSFC